MLYEVITRQIGVEVPEEKRAGGRTPHPAARSLTELMSQAARFYREQLKTSERATAYLKARGLTGPV